MIKRLAYLGYYLKNLDIEKFRVFFKYVKNHTGVSSTSLITDIIFSVLKYNISILEYFQFRFFELDDTARKNYAGTGYMYEYQLIMNPKSSRSCLDNKIEFYKRYSPFVRHKAYDIDKLRNNENLKADLLNNSSGKLVLKYSRGQCGWQVRIFQSDFFKDKDIVSYMGKNGFDLAEEFIVQHPDLMVLSPSGVNTVRVITQINANHDIDFLGARLRISENSSVDNMAAGNFAAPIDIDTGIINRPGVYSDITRGDVSAHPVTGVRIVGFQVPFWPELIDMAKKAALHVPENRSIGWDIAVTENGPELIEGNHDWCKLVWQLPVKKGMKSVLEGYLSDHK